MIHARRQSYARDSTADQGVAQGEPSRQPGSNSRVAARAHNPLPDIGAAFASLHIAKRTALFDLKNKISHR